MKVSELSLSGLLLFEPVIYSDERGYFFESYNDKIKQATGVEDFSQDNESVSKKDVLRGLHFQMPPFEQGKLVRVVAGSVCDVVVDIRKDSATFGKWFEIELSALNKRMLWIPPGFAHGFIALENDTAFLYKCTKPYHQASESGIIWNDEEIKIKWNCNSPIISEKDLKLPPLRNIESQF